MTFHETTLSGLWLIEPELKTDERGFFARLYCEKEFAARGLNTQWPQCNLTRTQRLGTLRGMHWQCTPGAEVKLLRCALGSIYDVVIDLRPESATRGKWQSFELSANTPRLLYVPAGFAHGFQALSESCEVFYQMSQNYDPSLACGVRWNDPAFQIHWPLNPVLSERDHRWPDWAPAA